MMKQCLCKILNNPWRIQGYALTYLWSYFCLYLPHISVMYVNQPPHPRKAAYVGNLTGQIKSTDTMIINLPCD